MAYLNLRSLWSAGRRRPFLAVGSLLGFGLVLLALLGPWIVRQDPTTRAPGARIGQPGRPSATSPLGTDSRGRDVLARLVHGARISLTVGAAGVAVSLTLALLVGVPAGFFGGRLDALLMRCTDVVLAFPAVLMALALAAVAPQRSLLTLVLVIGAVSWAGSARVFRSETLTLRERLWVDAGRALGASNLRLLRCHVLPHLRPTILVVASLNAGAIILLDAGLSYLGAGLRPPTPTWGLMLRDAQDYYRTAPWLAVWPGLLVLMAVTSLNLIAFDLARRPGAE